MCGAHTNGLGVIESKELESMSMHFGTRRCSRLYHALHHRNSLFLQRLDITYHQPIGWYALPDNNRDGTWLQIDGPWRHQRSGAKDDDWLNRPLAVDRHPEGAVLEWLQYLFRAVLRPLGEDQDRDAHVQDLHQPVHTLFPALGIRPVYYHRSRPRDPPEYGNLQ